MNASSQYTSSLDLPPEEVELVDKVKSILERDPRFHCLVGFEEITQSVRMLAPIEFGIEGIPDVPVKDLYFGQEWSPIHDLIVVQMLATAKEEGGHGMTVSPRSVEKAINAMAAESPWNADDVDEMACINYLITENGLERIDG